jgi:hypothetical protein
MPLPGSKKIALLSTMAFLLIAGLVVKLHFSQDSADLARQRLLQLLPADASAVIFVDFDELRASPFLAKLYAWAPQPHADSEYAQFVHDTGFSYERDLKRLVVAISNHGSTTELFAIAEGEFDRKKITAFLNRNGKSSQQGNWNVFRLNATANEKPITLAFLANDRIALGDFENLSAVLSTAPGDPSQAEWNARFARLAGTPLFAVIRQNPAIESALTAAAPGGFHSPQLAALLAQLQWISIAGKPESDQLRVVADGECLASPTASQLQEFLQGVLALAQDGLNDPKLRQKMNREERQTYLEILKSADVQKIDRGEWKSVRLALEITPHFLDMARLASLDAPAEQTSTPPELHGKTTDRAKTRTARKK